MIIVTILQELAEAAQVQAQALQVVAQAHAEVLSTQAQEGRDRQTYGESTAISRTMRNHI